MSDPSTSMLEFGHATQKDGRILLVGENHRYDARF
jgi:hypothetical protein